MSISQDDLVASLLNHQALVNFALDDTDINTLIIDYYVLNIEVIGVGSTEVLNTSVTHPPHLWDDGQSNYGFCSWT